MTEVLITEEFLVLVRGHRLMEMTGIHVRISYKIYGGETVSRGRKIQVDIGGPMLGKTMNVL